MDIPMELSLEQQFNLTVYEKQIEGLSAEQAQDFLRQLLHQMMLKDNVISYLLKKDLAQSF
ncbi:MAG: phycobilisome degradation protein nblA [Leptolyngbya sp. RL_3_1]|nr:phycobilisome degradation protein nblA [Leptolyngbya sp. RL_3_1]